MAEFVSDCPRCGSRRITFDLLGDAATRKDAYTASFEALAKCRDCDKCSVAKFHLRSSTGVSAQSTNHGMLSKIAGSVTPVYFPTGFVSVAHQIAISPPDYLPEAVANCFNEGATAFAVGAFNASAAMFRLALDIASKGLLPDKPPEEGGPNRDQRRKLFDRLNYLFDQRIVAPELRDLADCVREDGNDAAHDGTLTRTDAEDLIDFATNLLERVYSEPARLAQAKVRRLERRSAQEMK